MSKAAKVFSGPLLTIAGINHFVMPRTYEAIMPEYLPAHRELVYASGVTEFLGGVGSMIPATRRKAGLLSIATLIGVFPANLWMAQHPERYPKIPRWTLYLRLPLQLWMIWAVYTTTQRSDATV